MSYGEFTARVKEIATEYAGCDVANLSVGLAIEAYKATRNYPVSYDEERILADLNANINKIAMGAVEIDAKDGVENQTAHTENGIRREYCNGIMAYRDVIAFAHV